jgi:hypothetical protein
MAFHKPNFGISCFILHTKHFIDELKIEQMFSPHGNILGSSNLDSQYLQLVSFFFVVEFKCQLNNKLFIFSSLKYIFNVFFTAKKCFITVTVQNITIRYQSLQVVIERFRV